MRLPTTGSADNGTANDGVVADVVTDFVAGVVANVFGDVLGDVVADDRASQTMYVADNECCQS